MKGSKIHLQYFTPEEIKNSKAKEVEGILRTYLSDAAEFGASLLEKHCSKTDCENSVLLDCGTASGFFTKRASSLGFKKIYALDIADYLAPEIKAGGIITQLATLDVSFDKLPWPDEFFNVTTSWEILEHLENPHNFIREISRVLKPGGLFFVSIPNIHTLRSKKLFFRKGDVERYTLTNNHIALFTKSIFIKTVLKYFEPQAIKFRIDPKIYHSRFGILKKIILGRTWGYKKFAEWFGTDVFYVLKRK